MINLTNLFNIFAKAEDGCMQTFFGIPPWFKYLEVREANQCAPQLTNINDIWLIGLALIEIMTRVAVIITIAFVIYGGIKYSASRGNADKVENAKSTLIDALTGMVIAIVATAVISYVAGVFTQ
ncbi:MAG TPA: hypothetical protein VD947_00825 [Patescibacteria group bacterium]|nr:hypothetical protein [Patescibacteria group bacterium]